MPVMLSIWSCAAVVAGLLAGGSVRQLAEVTGMATNTIQRWVMRVVGRDRIEGLHASLA